MGGVKGATFVQVWKGKEASQHMYVYMYVYVCMHIIYAYGICKYIKNIQSEHRYRLFCIAVFILEPNSNLMQSNLEAKTSTSHLFADYK